MKLKKWREATENTHIKKKTTRSTNYNKNEPNLKIVTRLNKVDGWQQQTRRVKKKIDKAKENNWKHWKKEGNELKPQKRKQLEKITRIMKRSEITNKNVENEWKLGQQWG